MFYIMDRRYRHVPSRSFLNHACALTYSGKQVAKFRATRHWANRWKVRLTRLEPTLSCLTLHGLSAAVDLKAPLCSVPCLHHRSCLLPFARLSRVLALTLTFTSFAVLANYKAVWSRTVTVTRHCKPRPCLSARASRGEFIMHQMNTLAHQSSSVLRAEQFTFLIGADKTPITVHSGAIAGLSEPLNCVVNGAFQEACNNVARFPEITVDDFERICAILYQSSLPASEPVFLDPATFNIAEDFWILSPKIQSRRSMQIRNNRLTAHYLYTCFGDLNTHFGTKAATLGRDRWDNTVDDYSAVNLLDPNDYPKKPLQNVEPSIKQLQRQESERPPVQGWNQDVSGILMSYARRYIFADKYLIDSLKRDMERELRVALLQLDVYRPTRPGIF